MAWHRVLTLFLVMIGWVIFRAENVGTALAYYGAMFDVRNLSLNAEVAEAITNRSAVTLFLATIVFFLPGTFVAGRWLTRIHATTADPMAREDMGFVYAYRVALLVPILIIVAADVISGTFSPFLYFQF
jgi:alginate O-acetyltransferase complex protein AlgI